MSRTGLFWAILLTGIAAGHPSRSLAQEAWIAQVTPAQLQRSSRSGPPTAASWEAISRHGQGEALLRGGALDETDTRTMGSAVTPAEISQIGLGNGLTGALSGEHRHLSIVQTGNQNGISLVQDGAWNSLTLAQSGLGNQLAVTQSGEGLMMSSYQSGTGNLINLRQSGNLNIVQATQIGQSNQLGAIQSGAGNRLIAVQR